MTEGLEIISNYIDFLHKEHGLNVTIHSKGDKLTGITGALSQLNIHSNPFCIYIKSFAGVWNYCVSRQKKIYEYIDKNGGEIFFGSCFAGVGEFVVPVCESGEVYGFISVSGYRGDIAKLRRAAEKYMISKEFIENCREWYLKEQIPDIKYISALVLPVRSMLLLEIKLKPPEHYSKDEILINSALTYLHRNYASNISLAEITRRCHCSGRTLTRRFKQKTGFTVFEYIEKLRMENALSFLADSSMQITEIAFLCGYSDANYFTSRFSKYYGVSPSAKRESLISTKDKFKG